MRLLLASAFAIVLGCAASAAPAAAQPRPIVVELFTSQGCSDCPPADRFLTELAGSRPDVLALAFHVTYWNSLGWRDPYSFEGATDRQKRYAGISGQGTIYTPEAVIDGTLDAIGSDRAAVFQALRTEAAAARKAVAMQLTRGADGLAIGVDAGAGAGTVWLIGYDPQHRTQVGRGENAGRTLLESNIVRSVRAVGEWHGARLELHAAVPEGERVAVLLQAADGRILGAVK